MAYQIRLRLCPYGILPYVICFILQLAQLEVSVEAKGCNYYTAAVFEHVPYEDEHNGTAQEEIMKNLDRYSMAARTAGEQDADIIVFPEWGLYSEDKHLPFAEDVPDPSYEYWNPCENPTDFADRPVLLHLSCLAKENGMYIVVNIADVKRCNTEDKTGTINCTRDCRNCLPDGREFFNANLAFNRNGTLISRYYKRHLYFEPNFSVPTSPVSAFFETDFGWFTTFICFDISFREAMEAVRNEDVLNVAYSTYWFDHLPLMASIQFQQAFAITNRVNLLASNVHYLGSGTVGSGIYSGERGALVYTFNPDGEAKLLISRVPIGDDHDFETDIKIFRIRDEGAEDITNHTHDSNVPDQCSSKILDSPVDPSKEYRCHEMNTTTYSFKKLEQPVGSIEVCQNGVCCNLNYTAESMEEDYYLIAFSGINWLYNIYGFCEETCMMIRCDKENEKENCRTYPLVSSTRFHNFELSGSFTTNYVYPSVVKNKRRLASTEDWEFATRGGHTEIIYDPKSEDDGLILAAGLYGRCYDRDP